MAYVIQIKTQIFSLKARAPRAEAILLNQHLPVGFPVLGISMRTSWVRARCGSTTS